MAVFQGTGVAVFADGNMKTERSPRNRNPVRATRWLGRIFEAVLSVLRLLSRPGDGACGYKGPSLFQER